MLDNVELITYMKFQKILMTGCGDIDRKQQKSTQGGVSPVCDPKDFFQKSGSVIFVPLWCLNLMQKFRKSNGQSLKICKD